MKTDENFQKRKKKKDENMILICTNEKSLEFWGFFCGKTKPKGKKFKCKLLTGIFNKN